MSGVHTTCDPIKEQGEFDMMMCFYITLKVIFDWNSFFLFTSYFTSTPHTVYYHTGMYQHHKETGGYNENRIPCFFSFGTDLAPAFFMSSVKTKLLELLRLNH